MVINCSFTLQHEKDISSFFLFFYGVINGEAQFEQAIYVCVRGMNLWNADGKQNCKSKKCALIHPAKHKSV